MSAPILALDVQWASNGRTLHAVWWDWPPKVKGRCGLLFVPTNDRGVLVSKCSRCLTLMEAKR